MVFRDHSPNAESAHCCLVVSVSSCFQGTEVEKVFFRKGKNNEFIQLFPI